MPPMGSRYLSSGDGVARFASVRRLSSSMTAKATLDSTSKRSIAAPACLASASRLGLVGLETRLGLAQVVAHADTERLGAPGSRLV